MLLSLPKGIRWLTESKALARSMKTAAQYCLLSMAVMISCNTLSVAEVHPLPARKPDCTAEKVRWDSKWSGQDGYPVSCVNLSVLSLRPCLRTTWPDDSLLTTAAPDSTVLPAAMEYWPVHRTCYLSQTCWFQLSRDSRSDRDTLNDRLWKANWHLLLRCWPVAPSTTTVIIIIWPCWSSMNILAMFCYHFHPAQPEEDWTPLIAWFISRFLPRFWPF